MFEHVIGEKQIFGIELKVVSKNSHDVYMGFAKLWIGNIPLGTSEDIIYLNSYLLKELMRLKSVDEYNDSGFKSNKDIFNYFLNKIDRFYDTDYEKYRVSFGTMSDHFIIWAYKNDAHIKFIWKYVANPNDEIFKDLKETDSKVHGYKVPIKIFISHVNALDKLLTNKFLLSSSKN